ncbi:MULTISPECIES: hypothetical protein [unclassified Coleofasciculus]|nr:MULTISPECIES: hypothetical protein [unclassified Coleofasciculus]MBE9125728.1 hypothetical protein [Coleofasciculus sp. LEGE 07081]MBE9147216.1 hypothetical protein [Coleofasciculus sp. LEGE 07092]
MNLDREVNRNQTLSITDTVLVRFIRTSSRRESENPPPVPTVGAITL